MNVASAFAKLTKDEIKALLDGGTLTIYSVARPISADHAGRSQRSARLLHFRHAGLWRGVRATSKPRPSWPIRSPRSHVGTPGFARAVKADGTVVADFSVGPGAREIKLGEVSCAPGVPTKVVAFKMLPEGDWPERPDYYNAHPRPGYQLPQVP